MSENQRRKALNEAVFRAVNERIETLQHSFAVTQRLPLNIVCECDRLDCSDGLSVDPDTYEKVRNDSALFLVRPGHEDETVETVVDTGGDYMIVRKRPGEPQEIAEQTDPRE